MRRTRELPKKVSRFSDDNGHLKRQLEWALSGLRSNDKRNREIATEIAKKHGIRIRFVAAECGGDAVRGQSIPSKLPLVLGPKDLRDGVATPMLSLGHPFSRGFASTTIIEAQRNIGYRKT